jgi:hypothetical protein
MRQLDARDSSLSVQKLDHPRPGPHLLLAPNPGVPIRNPTLWADGTRFGDYESGTTGGERTQMNEVPVTRNAVPLDDRVLAHWRHPDPVAESHAANGQRGKKWRRGGGENSGHGDPVLLEMLEMLGVLMLAAMAILAPGSSVKR